MALNQDPYLRGSGESLDSLQTQASKHTNFYDSFNDFFGKGLDDQDFANREIDADGRVKVTTFDVLMGRSQPELQAAYETWRTSKIKGSEAFEAYRQTFGEDPVISGRMGTTDLAKAVTDEKTRRTDVDALMPTLASMEGGADVMATLGDKPTKASVLSAISALSTKNKGAERDRVTEKETAANLRSDQIRKEGYIEAAKIRNHTASEANNQRAHEAREKDKQLAFQTQQTNSRLAHEANENNKTRRYQAELAKHDSNTKLQLGMMESADRRADRSARREEAAANQRIASINALIKGLTQLGAGMAI